MLIRGRFTLAGRRSLGYDRARPAGAIGRFFCRLQKADRNLEATTERDHRDFARSDQYPGLALHTRAWRSDSPASWAKRGIDNSLVFELLISCITLYVYAVLAAFFQIEKSSERYRHFS